MLNWIWLGLLVGGTLIAGFSGRMKPAVDGAIGGAQQAVTLAIGFVGIMALWLGVMRLADQAGLVRTLAAWLRPVLRRLFPDVPENHPALGSIVMNTAANMLGLTNAATPLGLRAMKDLETLNPTPGTATNAMCTFLAINTSSVQLIPVTAIAVLAAGGSTQPTAIVGTAFLATFCSTIAGIAAVKWLQQRKPFRLPPATSTSPMPDPGKEDGVTFQTPAPPAGATALSTAPAPPTLVPLAWAARMVLVGLGGAFVVFFIQMIRSTSTEDPTSGVVRGIESISLLAIPLLLTFIPLYAALRKVPVYEAFIEGAKEGFQVGVRIIPFLVAMLTAIGLFRGGGGIELLTRLLQPVLEPLGFPVELLPMSMIRPLTGTGTLALFSDLVAQHGADSLIARTAGTLFGSTETTFYVVVVYFGSVGIRRTRHAVAAGLIADAVGVAASILICRCVFA